MAMDRSELQAELTTSLAERMFGDGLPESIFSAGGAESDLATDDVGFVDVFRHEMIDSVPQLSRKAE
jgi:hypothetical protein